MSSTLTTLFDQWLPQWHDDAELPRHELILCRFCHAAITSQRQARVIGASHQHRFMNPSGLQFLVGCFQQAPGCDISGRATQEYCWFPGYAWQLAKCCDCGEHLGWFYQDGESDQFYGLIVDKLVRYRS